MIINELKKEIRTRYISKSIIFINIIFIVTTISQIYFQFIPYLNVTLTIESIPINYYIFTASFTLVNFSNQTIYSLRVTNEKYLGVIDNIIMSPVSIFRYCTIRAVVCSIENIWMFLIFSFLSLHIFEIGFLQLFFFLVFSLLLTVTWGIFFNLLNIIFRDVRFLYLILDSPSELVSGSIVPKSYLPVFISAIGMIYPHRWMLEILRSNISILYLVKIFIFIFVFNLMCFCISKISEKYKQNWGNY